jgi:beta-xylosidase
MDHTDRNASASERASALLQQMTLPEKVAQLQGVLPHPLGAPHDITREKLDSHLGHGIGHLAGVGTAAGNAAGIAALVAEVQDYLREHTRLGIPAIVHNETLNGVSAEGFTSFPTPIGLAATWDPERVREMADLIRRQAVASGIRQGLAPVLDVSRDARWGRTHETYGEDPHLASAFGVAYVGGLQGASFDDGIIATAKHFVGYSMTEGGQNMAATQLGPRELRDVYAAPFEAAIRLAGLQSVMNSYSEIDGQPVATSREILTGLLRETLGFDGTVVSDYRSLYYIVNRQGIGTAESVGAAALHAGLDVELPAPFGFGETLLRQVEAGTVPMADLDLAVHRTLTHKFALGLFDNPFSPMERTALIELAESGRDLSRSLADESITLLKNTGALPLQAGTGTVAVVGPHADSVMAGFGNYTHPPFLETLRGILTGQSRMAGLEQTAQNTDPAAQEKMRARMAELAKLDPEAIARASYGAKTLVQALDDALPDTRMVTAPGTGVLDEEPADIAAAVAAAAEADVIVVAFGGRSAAFAGRATEGEGSDSATMKLPSNQVALIEALAALGKPLVGVVYLGKPYALAAVEHRFDALLTGYIPGPEGGAALADVLTGMVNPSGKLPFTVPRHVGQTPIFVGQKRGSGQRRNTAVDQFRGYVDLENTPLYPFGHGLSYTTFGYTDLQVTAPASDGHEITVSATVTNTGTAAGTEVAQLYVSAPGVVLTRPDRQLAGFARVSLEPGASARVTIRLDARQLGYTCEDGRFVVDPGRYGVAVGGSSEDPALTGEFELTAPRTVVETPHAHLSTAEVTAL